MIGAATLALPVAVPLVGAATALAAGSRQRLHRLLATSVHAGVLVLGVALLAETLDGTVIALSIGGWPADVAITFAADALSSLMLCVSAALVLAGTAFAAATADDDSPVFTPLTLVMTAGVYGAFLTCDLFDFFVFVEVMLVPSYALLTQSGGAGRARAGQIYVTTSLLASTLLLAGVALVYGVAGTVDLGELAGIAHRNTGAALAGGVVLLALAVKAAVVPLHGWLPRTYPAAPAAVTVLFSGLLTKVAVYGIARIYAVVFDGTELGGALMTLALLTMVVGVLGAVGERTVRGVLSFHMVSQIGYILFGIALFTPAALTAAVFFQTQYVLVKAALLTCAGAIGTTYGTDRLDRLSGLAVREPLLAAAFIVSAFSLAGLPPLSGFAAKLSLVRAAASTGDHLALGVAVTVSLLTLMSMLKIWEGAFWGGEQRGPSPAPTTPLPHRRVALAAPALALAVPSLLFGIWAQPLFTAATAAAEGLATTTAYVEAVTR